MYCQRTEVSHGFKPFICNMNCVCIPAFSCVQVLGQNKVKGFQDIDLYTFQMIASFQELHEVQTHTLGPSTNWNWNNKQSSENQLGLRRQSCETCLCVQILSHTGLIDSDSEVETYLHKVLKDGVAGTNARNDEISENVKVKDSPWPCCMLCFV